MSRERCDFPTCVFLLRFVGGPCCIYLQSKPRHQQQPLLKENNFVTVIYHNPVILSQFPTVMDMEKEDFSGEEHKCDEEALQEKKECAKTDGTIKILNSVR